MRRVAARDTHEFDIPQIRQRVGNCEHVDSDFDFETHSGR
jgi:hypothetical protein